LTSYWVCSWLWRLWLSVVSSSLSSSLSSYPHDVPHPHTYRTLSKSCISSMRERIKERKRAFWLGCVEYVDDDDSEDDDDENVVVIDDDDEHNENDVDDDNIKVIDI
jgi:hypothetical protein